MKLLIPFYPGVDPKDLESTGAFSEIGWQALAKFLDPAFAITEDEKIVGVIVTETGIKAKIERKKTTNQP